MSEGGGEQSNVDLGHGPAVDGAETGSILVDGHSADYHGMVPSNAAADGQDVVPIGAVVIVVRETVQSTALLNHWFLFETITVTGWVAD